MKDRKSIFFTSDWHVGHANSIVYDKRPFKDLDHMHRVLVNNYNSTVPEDGLCYFLGDVGFHKEGIIKTILDQLHGTKVLVLGNHDRGVNTMYGCGFDVVVHGITLWIAEREVTLTHCPLRGVFRENVEGMKGAKDGENWHGEHKQLKYSTIDRGQFHLHGHIHSGPANDKPRIDGKQMDIGAPANNYIPVSISAVESWISKYSG